MANEDCPDLWNGIPPLMEHELSSIYRDEKMSNLAAKSIYKRMRRDGYSIEDARWAASLFTDEVDF